MTPELKAPFPYFGGKRKVADAIWERFGDVRNYVEPFFGSGAVLLGRPQPFIGNETVNDADGLLSNFWRALKAEPETVAYHADWPVNENDLHARHAWLVGRKESLQAKLEGDPNYFDVKIAGWWVWGMCCWIGSGFCSGQGPWQVVDDQLVHLGDNGQGVSRQLVHLGNNGQGVSRQLVHLGNNGHGVNRKRVHLGNNGHGVNRKREGITRKRPIIAGVAGGSVLPADAVLVDYFEALAHRLRGVRVCCGDWSRVMGSSVTTNHGITGIFLDPPYSEASGCDSRLYRVDCLKVATEVRQWCIDNGNDPLLRIALCGYEGEHQMPDDWEMFNWNAGAGYGGQRSEGTSDNGKKERIWFSPHCLKPNQALFNFATTPLLSL